MTVGPATLRASGTYFAEQYNFANAPQVGYTGLQPRPDTNGHRRLHGVFSSFNAGTTSTDPNCHNGADNGAGVSCAAEFDAVYGHTYAVTVARTGTDTWTGTATDTVTGAGTHIGTYTLPAGSGNLTGSEVGFVEYYLSSPSCARLPRIDVVFGAPTSTDAGGLTGVSRAEHEYSDCIGQADYKATAVGNGVHVTRGWVNAPGTPSPTGPPSTSAMPRPSTPSTTVTAGTPTSAPASTPPTSGGGAAASSAPRTPTPSPTVQIEAAGASSTSSAWLLGGTVGAAAATLTAGGLFLRRRRPRDQPDRRAR
jgi:cell division septation protein DedD